jgi:hypothetical protein
VSDPLQEYEKLRREIDALLAGGEAPAPGGAGTRGTPAIPAASASGDVPARRGSGGLSIPTASLLVSGGIAAVVFVVCGLLPFVPALGPAIGAFIGALIAGWLVPTITHGKERG